MKWNNIFIKKRKISVPNWLEKEKKRKEKREREKEINKKIDKRFVVLLV